MARTFKDKKRFPYRITLVPTDEIKPFKPAVVGTQRWKHRAIYNVTMLLTMQARKASRRAKRKWYQYYSVRGYGAPSSTEFICQYSGMIAKTIDQQEAASARRYWAECAAKSNELLQWLKALPPERYTRELNHLMLRMIVISIRQREVDYYIKLHPFQEPKPWRELQSSTTSDLQLVGQSSALPRLTIASRSAGKRCAQIAR